MDSRVKDVFVSLDIESSGPFPFINSMWSLGAVAIGWKPEEGWIVSHSFGANLKDYPSAVCDKETMTFWAKQPVAWAKARENAQSPESVMHQFSHWLGLVQDTWRGRPVVAMAAPAGFDYPFIRGYMLKFLGTDKPFGHKCDDTRARAASVLKIPYSEAHKSAFPRHWFKEGLPHTHVAVEDALEQALTFSKILDDIYRT